MFIKLKTHLICVSEIRYLEVDKSENQHASGLFPEYTVKIVFKDGSDLVFNIISRAKNEASILFEIEEQISQLVSN